MAPAELAEKRNLVKRLMWMGRRDEATKLLISLWEAGDPNAAQEIGFLEEEKWATGQGSLTVAEHWFEQAAREQRTATSEYNLARIKIKRFIKNDLGSIDDQEIKSAIAILESLADQNMDRPTVLLAFLYFRGELVEKDMRRAEVLSETAAEGGYIVAYAMLARIALERRAYFRAARLALMTLYKILRNLFADKSSECWFLLISRQESEISKLNTFS